MSDNQNELDKLFENYDGSNNCKEFETGRPVGKEYSPEVAENAIEEIAYLISEELNGHRARLEELKKLRAAAYSGDGDAIEKVLAMAKENRLNKAGENSCPDTEVSARGMSWDEYEKANYTPDEIAASDKRVAKMSKKIERKQRRRGL